MAEIPDSLRLLFTSKVEHSNGRYLVEIPEDQIERADPAVSPNESYRVAIIDPVEDSEESPHIDASQPERETEQKQGPPVEEGEVRTVTIETLGDQGDGIAKVERGYVLIVPGGQPGDELTVRVEQVRENVGFAEMIRGEE